MADLKSEKKNVLKKDPKTIYTIHLFWLSSLNLQLWTNYQTPSSTAPPNGSNDSATNYSAEISLQSPSKRSGVCSLVDTVLSRALTSSR